MPNFRSVIRNVNTVCTYLKMDYDNRMREINNTIRESKLSPEGMVAACLGSMTSLEEEGYGDLMVCFAHQSLGEDCPYLRCASPFEVEE